MAETGKAPRPSIRLTSNGTIGKLEIGGVDVSAGVSAVTIRIGASKVPEVSVDLIATDFQSIVSGWSPPIGLPEATREALIWFGWTPPADPSLAPTVQSDD